MYNISVNNNTNFNFLKILSTYTIWDRLSQKTILRYFPSKPIFLPAFQSWIFVREKNRARALVLKRFNYFALVVVTAEVVTVQYNSNIGNIIKNRRSFVKVLGGGGGVCFSVRDTFFPRIH